MPGTESRALQAGKRRVGCCFGVLCCCTPCRFYRCLLGHRCLFFFAAAEVLRAAVAWPRLVLGLLAPWLLPVFVVVCGGVNMERLGVNYHVLWVACCVVWRAVAGAVMTRNLSVGLQACYLYVQGVSGHSG